jgi:hypothetical protein
VQGIRFDFGKRYEMNVTTVRQRTAAALIGAVLALAGCTPTPPTSDAETTPTPGPTEATVTTRTIVDAITLTPTASAGNTYTVTAPSAGALIERPAGWEFRRKDGSTIPLTVPTTATAVAPLAPNGIEVAAFTPLLQITDSALLLVADVTPTQVLRLGTRTPISARAQIDGSSAPFDCPLTDPRAQSQDDAYRMMCRIPASVPAVVGATGTLVVVLAKHDDVTALPVEAVTGTIEHGEVYPVGGSGPVEVKLGATDGMYVEVTGLRVGERVKIPAPGIVGG